MSAEGFRLGAEAARRLAMTGRFQIAPGLSDTEVSHVEHDYGFEFADDHRAFLQAGIPLNIPPEEQPPGEYHAWLHPWPDWRYGHPDELRDQLGWPVEGVLLKVERQGLWLPSWGSRPAGLDDALATARRYLEQEPQMIPVYAHRYLPGGHGSGGHPVLSMWTTDIIVYGTDLADYINQDFGSGGLSIDVNWTPPELVPFWGDFVPNGSVDKTGRGLCSAARSCF